MKRKDMSCALKPGTQETESMCDKMFLIFAHGV